MSTKKTWWSRYGNYDPGVDGYPHMGQVITDYRIKRGFRRQEDLAIALNVSKRTVEELEGSANMEGPDSIERRKLLVRVLHIPPALLALDWHFLVDQTQTASLEEMMQESSKHMEEETFSLYQNILLMGRGYLYNGGPPYIAAIIDESVQKLVPLVGSLPALEKEVWHELLCRFYLLSTSFALRSLLPKETFARAKKAIDAALELENADLIASAYYRRARVYLDFSKVAESDFKKRKHIQHAHEDIQTALRYKERIHPILKGNIFLIAAEIQALLAHDASLKKHCEQWQEKAATLVYKGETGEDDTFLLLNATALHHEKAKTLLLLGKTKEALTEVVTARKTLSPDVLTWHINLNLTEARIYEAQRDLAASAQMGLEAYRIAKVVHSHKDERAVQQLFLDLQRLDQKNPYVCRLGLVIGMI